MPNLNFILSITLFKLDYLTDVCLGFKRLIYIYTIFLISANWNDYFYSFNEIEMNTMQTENLGIIVLYLKFKRKKFNARGSLGNLKTSFIFSQFSCSLYYAYIRVVLLLTLNLTWHTTMYLGFILHSILWFAYNHKIIWISHTSTINIINEI